MDTFIRLLLECTLAMSAVIAATLALLPRAQAAVQRTQHFAGIPHPDRGAVSALAAFPRRTGADTDASCGRSRRTDGFPAGHLSRRDRRNLPGRRIRHTNRPRFANPPPAPNPLPFCNRRPPAYRALLPYPGRACARRKSSRWFGSPASQPCSAAALSRTCAFRGWHGVGRNPYATLPCSKRCGKRSAKRG